MPAITNEKYSRLLAEHGNCGLEVVMPGGETLSLHEQNGGYSTLFNEAGDEVYEVEPDGNVVNGYTGSLICTFDQVIATGALAPWLERNADGEIVGRV